MAGGFFVLSPLINSDEKTKPPHLANTRWGDIFQMKAYRNEMDRTGRASEQGATAESNFKKSIDGFFGSSIELTGVHNGQFDHIDFRCNVSMDVDVKSIKDPETLWIEFKGISGKAGWLYGRATHFAFERENEFQIVCKGDLIKLVDSLVDKDTHVSSPKACMYKMYSRKKYGRDDLLSKIHPDDLYKIPYILVSKNASDSTPRKDDSSCFI